MPGIIAENHPRKISDNTEKLNHEEEKAMEALFQAVNVICGKIQIVSNLFWDFPTNFDWYANIPILGNFSLAIILLVGTGIYFTFRLRFIQVRKFRHGHAWPSTGGMTPGMRFLCRCSSVSSGHGVRGGISAPG